MSPQVLPPLVPSAPGGQPTLRLVTGEAPEAGEPSGAPEPRGAGESWSPGQLAAGDSLQPGDRLGRFIVRGVLGEGGMSVVYDAFDPELERGVALKRIKLRGAGGAEGPDDLIAEARALARLNHPNVV